MAKKQEKKEKKEKKENGSAHAFKRRKDARAVPASTVENFVREAHACLLSLAQQARSSQATKRRSLPVAAKRDGGGVGLPGTGSPRKILALERCKQHEIAAYQRWISADGSRPKAAARLCASFLINPTVSFAQKPCRSNDNAQKSNGCIRR